MSPATAAVRKPITARTAPRSTPAPRKPPLRLFEPTPRRRRQVRRRSSLVIVTSIVVASLLSVVVADDLVAQDQIGMATAQSQLLIAQNQQHLLQVSVAQMSAPQIVVTEAQRLGLVAPPEVVDLPHVPLNVALAVPDTTPLPGVSTPASKTGVSSPA